MTMITPSYLGETIEYSSLHACRSTLEDPRAVERLGAPAAIDSSGGGAGLGFCRLAAHSELIAIRVVPGKETEVLCAVRLQGTRNRAQVAKSVFFFQGRG